MGRFAHLRSLMKKTLPVFALLLSGCQGVERAATNVRDPATLLESFAGVVVTIGFLLFFFTNWSIWKNLLNSLRYTGAIALTVSPLYAIMMDNTLHAFRAGVAMAVTGLLAIAVSSFLLWETERKKSDE